jgi:hypothetical protein
MFKVLFIMLFSGMLTAFTVNNHSSTDPGTLKELPGYKFVGKDLVQTDFNLWIITNEDAFYDAFMPETDEVPRPQFGKEMVLAAKVQTYANSYDVRFTKTVVRQNELNVYFNVKRKNDVSVDDSSVTLAIFPKNKEVRKVNFYHDDVFVRSVPIVTVY